MKRIHYEVIRELTLADGNENARKKFFAFAEERSR